jgi:hypothetical protein
MYQSAKIAPVFRGHLHDVNTLIMGEARQLYLRSLNGRY